MDGVQVLRPIAVRAGAVRSASPMRAQAGLPYRLCTAGRNRLGVASRTAGGPLPELCVQ
jgi:hypothetical protein